MAYSRGMTKKDQSKIRISRDAVSGQFVLAKTRNDKTIAEKWVVKKGNGEAREITTKKESVRSMDKAMDRFKGTLERLAKK